MINFILRSKARVSAAVVAVALIAAGAVCAFVRPTRTATASASALYPYKANEQWYNGPVERPSLSGDSMAFVTLWEGNGRNLYVSDIAHHTDAKITINAPVSDLAAPVASENFVVWHDTMRNKWQVKLFERYSYTTTVIADTVNQVGRPALDAGNVVWREANNDVFGSMIRFYNNETKEQRTLAAGKWYSDPVISGSRIAWFESSAQCDALAYRLCVPQNTTWDLVVYNLTTNSMETVARGVTTKYVPAIGSSFVVWSAYVDGQFDLFKYAFTTGVTERLTNSQLEEAYPVIGNGRIAYLGIPKSGSPRVAHVIDAATKEDTKMPYSGANQSGVTVSGNRVAWTEVRADSRIYVYDFAANASMTDVDADGVSASDEAIRGTNDTLKDTDGDGLSDTDEVVLFRTNPLATDSDGDGLSDYAEVYRYGTNAIKFDTDGDGYNDGLEIKNNYSPTNPKPLKLKNPHYEWTAPAR